MTNQHTTAATTDKHLRTVFTPLRTSGLLAVGALVLAACSSGGGKAAAGNQMGAMAMGNPPATNATSSTPIATNAVQIKNFAFSPATITVKAGAAVVWTNSDSVAHDISFDTGGIASSVLNHNDTF